VNILINSSELFKSALLSPIIEIYIMVELYSRNGVLLDYITEQINSDSIGDISVDSKRDIRRMFTLTLDNRNSKFTWNKDRLIWIDNKFIKLYIGLKLPTGEIEYIPQGVFILTEPQATHKPAENTVTLNGQDRWYLLSGNFGRFTHETTIPKGTTIKNAIKIIAEGAEITDMILDECDITVPYDLTYNIGSNRGEALKELAQKAYTLDNLFYDIYFDVNGYLRFEAFKDVLLEAPVWTYKIDDNTLYAGSVRKLNDKELFNHIFACGGSSNTAEFSSTLIIDENIPAWIGHPYSIQKIGNRFFAWNNGNPDSAIDTQSQCDARVKYELNKNLRFSEEVELHLAPNYLHEGNDVIEIIDDENGCSGYYQLKSFTIPIKPKLVTANAVKVVKGLT